MWSKFITTLLILWCSQDIRAAIDMSVGTSRIFSALTWSITSLPLPAPELSLSISIEADGGASEPASCCNVDIELSFLVIFVVPDPADGKGSSSRGTMSIKKSN